MRRCEVEPSHRGRPAGGFSARAEVRRPLPQGNKADLQRRAPAPPRCPTCKTERCPSAVRALWDFSGTSGFINRHEHETTERPFKQVSAQRPVIVAGHRASWSLPRHLISRDRQLCAPASAAFANLSAIATSTGPDLPNRSADTPSERASDERHGRHFSVKISPITPTSHMMRTHKTAGHAPFATGSRIATHSTWCVIGKV